MISNVSLLFCVYMYVKEYNLSNQFLIIYYLNTAKSYINIYIISNATFIHVNANDSSVI